jgi:transposase-like protein
VSIVEPSQRTSKRETSQRRVNRRKLTDDDVSEAAGRYGNGDSLAKVALAFNVDAATLRRELHRSGVATRLRRGWT